MIETLQPSLPSETIRAAVAKLSALVDAVESPDMPEAPWHTEQCADPGLGQCRCIVAQGRVPFAADSLEATAAHYIADTEHPDLAAYVAVMHPAFGRAVLHSLDRQAQVAQEVEQFLGIEFQDGALDLGVHDALAIARQILRTPPEGEADA